MPGRIAVSIETVELPRGCRVRPARPDDAEAVGRIRVAAWRAAYRGVMPDDYLDAMEAGTRLDGLRSRLAAPGPAFRVLAGELDGAMQGFIIIGTPRFDTAAAVSELCALNLAPEAWGRGLGQALIAAGLEAARGDGAQRMALWCVEANTRARRCYERAGFAAGGARRTTDDLTGHPLTEVDYWRNL